MELTLSAGALPTANGIVYDRMAQTGLSEWL